MNQNIRLTLDIVNRYKAVFKNYTEFWKVFTILTVVCKQETCLLQQSLQERSQSVGKQVQRIVYCIVKIFECVCDRPQGRLVVDLSSIHH